MAHHLTEAGLLERAVDRWRTAGRTAVERSAFTEAVGHFTKGLQLLAELPDGETLALELDLQIALGPALIATRGFAAPEVGRAYRRARELCGLLGEHERRVPALWGSWVFHTVRAELAEANRLGYELLELTRSLGNRDLLLQAHHALETSLFWSGRLKEALQHTRLGLAIYAPDRHLGQAASFAGHDPGVCCLAFQALALWLSGHPDQAERSRAEAIALARRVQQPGSLAHAQQLSCRLHVLRRDPAAALAEAEDLIDFALRHGFPHPLGVARIAHGWARAHAGDVEAGIAGLEEGLRTFEASGAALGRATHLGMFAEILGRAGRRSEAMELIDAALEHIERSEERVQEAELWRLKGELLGGSGPDRAREEAERCLGQALEVARRQEARSLELRAATSLARLWAEHGRRRDAHDLLAPIHSWFSEGFDTHDLKDAKALLDELA